MAPVYHQLPFLVKGEQLRFLTSSLAKSSAAAKLGVGAVTVPGVTEDGQIDLTAISEEAERRGEGSSASKNLKLWNLLISQMKKEDYVAKLRSIFQTHGVPFIDSKGVAPSVKKEEGSVSKKKVLTFAVRSACKVYDHDEQGNVIWENGEPKFSHTRGMSFVNRRAQQPAIYEALDTIQTEVNTRLHDKSISLTDAKTFAIELAKERLGTEVQLNFGL